MSPPAARLGVPGPLKYSPLYDMVNDAAVAFFRTNYVGFGQALSPTRHVERRKEHPRAA